MLEQNKVGIRKQSFKLAETCVSRRNVRVRRYQLFAKLNSSILIATLVPRATSAEHTNPLEPGLLFHLSFFTLHVSFFLTLCLLYHHPKAWVENSDEWTVNWWKCWCVALYKGSRGTSEGAFYCGTIITSWTMTMMMTPPKLYVGKTWSTNVCVCFLLYYGPLYQIKIYKKEKKKQHNPWSYVKIIVRFCFTKIEYWSGNTTLDGEIELSVLMF